LKNLFFETAEIAKSTKASSAGLSAASSHESFLFDRGDAEEEVQEEFGDLRTLCCALPLRLRRDCPAMLFPAEPPCRHSRTPRV